MKQPKKRSTRKPVRRTPTAHPAPSKNPFENHPVLEHRLGSQLVAIDRVLSDMEDDVEREDVGLNRDLTTSLRDVLERFRGEFSRLYPIEAP